MFKANIINNADLKPRDANHDGVRSRALSHAESS